MLKKLSHITLSVLLLFATTGFSKSSHSCGGDRITVNIFADKEECCDGSMACCHEETILTQIYAGYISTSFDSFSWPAKVNKYNTQRHAFNGTKKGSARTALLNHPPYLSIYQKVQTYLQVFQL